MRYSFLSQIALIIVAFLIIFGFIRPTLSSIGTVQDQVTQYKDAVSKASELNARLQQLVDTEKSFSQNQLALLQAFIPNTLDTLEVMREIQAIFAVQKVPVTSISAKNIVVPATDVTVNGSAATDIPSEIYQDITVKFSGSYSDLKNILQAAEANTTLLEVTDLTFTDAKSDATPRDGGAPDSASQDGLYDFNVTFRTYALGSSTPSTSTNQS